MKKLLAAPVSLFFIFLQAQTNDALSFNGTDNYVSIGAPISSNSSYTKEAWVFVTDNTGARNIISSLNAPFWIQSGVLKAGQAGNFTNVVDPTALPLNTWVYVAVTYDASTGVMTLYRDGILVNSASSVPAYTSESTFIGSHQGSTSFFKGNIDEVRIWSVALSQAELKKNMFRGPADNAAGLLAHYKFNEGSGPTLMNSCTNTTGLDGAIQNSPSWVASPVQFSGNAIAFDGANDMVTIPSNSSLNLTTAITLEAWVYATKNSGIQNVINKSSNTMNTGYIFPRTDDGWTHLVFYLHIGGWHVLSVPYGKLNEWHHLAATFDGITMAIFIDGAPIGGQTVVGSITTNTNPLSLGNQTGFSEFFGGMADEFRVWNIKRTQAEIQADMNNEIDPSTETGLVSYYNSDQGVAGGTNTGLTTLPDLSGNNNGILTSFSLTGSTSNFVTQKSGLVILPLKWLSFTAQQQNENIMLSWITADEQNTKDFLVQHSIDGQTWIDLATVLPIASTNPQHEYQYLHSSPSLGINYYRILQGDMDGHYSYSETRTVKITKQSSSFVVLVNPVNDGVLKIQVNNPSILSFYNYNGVLIWRKQLAPGSQTVNVKSLPKGTYLVGDGERVEKVIIN